MSEAAPTALPMGPRLLVEWSSPWREFLTALRPALSRSPKKLAGEAPTGMFPFSGMLASWILECLLLSVSITLPGRLSQLQPYAPLPRLNEDVIYFSGEELPQTEDSGGTDTGKSGRAGGHEDYHRTQTIKVARGTSLTEKVVDVPKFDLPKSDLPVANLLAVNKIPDPPPVSGLTSSLPSFPQAAAVAPPPEVAREKNQAVPPISSSVIVPPPEISREKLRGGPVVPSSVVAPPPKVADNSRAHELTFTSSVVRPSPSLEGTTSSLRAPMSHAIEVVPPPVSTATGVRSIQSRLMLPQTGVVGPPPSGISRELSSHDPVQRTVISKEVVPPPAEVGQAMGRTFSGGLVSPAKVVAPPPGQVAGSIRGRNSAGELASTNIVPPPPVVSGGSPRSRPGAGRAGTGLGADLEAGSVLGPPRAGRSEGKNVGVVTSDQPGPRFAVPSSGGAGAIAMSPTGNANRGIGGADGGKGIGVGSGAGSGLNGGATGAGKLGEGLGSDPSSHRGISPYPGPGGAGKATAGTPPAPGISVSGGTTVTLPSFAGNVDGSNGVSRSRLKNRRRDLNVTVKGSSRSGGAFDYYGRIPELKGDNYTIYFDTPLGTAVLQYVDAASSSKAYSEELRAPEALRTDMPSGLGRSRMVLACILDRSGMLRNVRVLEGGAAEMNGKVLAALATWKFQPAMRADQPVEVNAILGFNIDTR